MVNVLLLAAPVTVILALGVAVVVNVVPERIEEIVVFVVVAPITQETGSPTNKPLVLAVVKTLLLGIFPVTGSVESTWPCASVEGTKVTL